jgi:hypothetical protein
MSIELSEHNLRSNTGPPNFILVTQRLSFHDCYLNLWFQSTILVIRTYPVINSLFNWSINERPENGLHSCPVLWYLKQINFVWIWWLFGNTSFCYIISNYHEYKHRTMLPSFNGGSWNLFLLYKYSKKDKCSQSNEKRQICTYFYLMKVTNESLELGTRNFIWRKVMHIFINTAWNIFYVLQIIVNMVLVGYFRLYLEYLTHLVGIVQIKFTKTYE